MRYRNVVPFVFLLSLVLMSLVGCWNQSNPAAVVATQQLAANIEFPIGEGNGTNQVKLNKIADGLNTISIQIKITDVSPDFDTIATVKTSDGKTRELKKASIPSDGIILAANDIDFRGIEKFDSISFSTPIPPGAKVEILNVDLMPKFNPNLRASVNSYIYRMDYDGSETVVSGDIAIFMAYLISNQPSDSVIIGLANELWTGSPDSILSVPTVLHDDLNQDGKLDSSDAVMLISWYQVGPNREAMLTRAKELYSGVEGNVINRPLELLNNYTFDVPYPIPTPTLNNYQVQIRIRNVSPDFETSTFLSCYRASQAEKPVLWYKSENVTIADGIVLICSIMEPYSVKPFDLIRFTNKLPDGSIVEIFNNDTKEVIQAKTINLSHTLQAISLSPSIKEIANSSILDLSTITVTSHYFDGSTGTATNTSWIIKSGGGSLNLNQYQAPAADSQVFLTCSSIEEGITKEADLKVFVGITADTPSFVRSWTLPDPAGMAFNGSGNLLVNQYWGGGIAEYDTNGTKLTIHPYSYSRSNDLAISNAGQVYTADIIGGNIKIFDNQWNIISQLNGFSNPCGITFDSEGNFYLAESGANKVKKMNASGTLLMSWGTAGYSGPSNFVWPRTVAIDAQGFVYVADYYGCRIQKFSVIGSSSTYICEWGGKGTAIGKFGYLEDIRIDSRGYMYAADRGNHRVVVFDINQTPTSNPNSPSANILSADINSSLYVTDWGSYGRGNGQFVRPVCIIPTDGGQIYVSDYSESSSSSLARIQVFQMP